MSAAITYFNWEGILVIIVRKSAHWLCMKMRDLASEGGGERSKVGKTEKHCAWRITGTLNSLFGDKKRQIKVVQTFLT